MLFKKGDIKLDTMHKVPYNYNKPNQYRYYHICILDDDKEIDKQYDLSIDEVKSKIAETKDKYIVLGTIEKVNDCVEYVNRENSLNGILGFNITKEDIFKSNESIFVNCTKYFSELK